MFPREYDGVFLEADPNAWGDIGGLWEDSFRRPCLGASSNYYIAVSNMPLLQMNQVRLATNAVFVWPR